MRYWYNESSDNVDYSKTEVTVRVVIECGEYNAKFTGQDAAKLAVEHAASVISGAKNKKVILVSIVTDVYLIEDQNK